MRIEDKVFLDNFISFSGYNRIVSVLNNKKALSIANELAVLTWSAAYHISAEEALERVVKQDANNIITETLITKIFSEFVASLEDFGTLCYAIRNRDDQGIFFKYHNSKTSDAGNFFKYVEENENATLDEVLKIESIESLKDRVEKSIFDIVKHDYRSFRKTISEVTKNYRVAGLWEGTCKDIPNYRENHIYVILEFRKSGDQRRPIGVLPNAHNKIKHGFSVYKSLEPFRSIGEGRIIKYGALCTETSNAEYFITNTIEVSRRMLEICCFLLKIAEYDLLSSQI